MTSMLAHGVAASSSHDKEILQARSSWLALQHQHVALVDQHRIAKCKLLVPWYQMILCSRIKADRQKKLLRMLKCITAKLRLVKSRSCTRFAVVLLHDGADSNVFAKWVKIRVVCFGLVQVILGDRLGVLSVVASFAGLITTFRSAIAHQ